MQAKVQPIGVEGNATTGDSAAALKTSEQDKRIPIVLGVTGHRDVVPSDIPDLERSVATVLRDIQKLYPNTPLVIASALAEGSDRIVAKVGLSLGATLTAVLPFSRDEYLKDFELESSRTEFARLLAQATNIIELTNPTGPKPRDYGYVQLGAYLANYSTLLIALWDELPSSLAGGTADVVRFRTDGIPPDVNRWNLSAQLNERGRIIVVRTPRLRHPERITDPFRVSLIGMADKTSLRVDECVHLDRLNKKLSEDYPGEHYPLLNKDSDSLLTPALRSLQDTFCAVDGLAIDSQRQSTQTLKLVLCFGFLCSGLIHVVRDHFSPLLAFTCLASGTAAYAIFYWRVTRNRVQQNHIDYRGIAEALRIQFFWSLLGIRERASDVFLRSPADEGSWIRTSLLGVATKVESSPSKTTLTLAHRAWIQDQAAYFKRTFQKQFLRNLRLETLRFVLLLFAGLISVVPLSLYSFLTNRRGATIVLIAQICFGLFAIGWQVFTRFREIQKHRKTLHRLGILDNDRATFQPDEPLLDYWNGPKGILITSLGAVALTLVLSYFRDAIGEENLNLLSFASIMCVIALYIFSNRSAFSENFKRYGRMCYLSSWIDRHLRESLESGNIERSLLLFRQYGEEALLETGEWIRLHRSRPIQAPEFSGPHM